MWLRQPNYKEIPLEECEGEGYIQKVDAHYAGWQLATEGGFRGHGSRVHLAEAVSGRIGSVQMTRSGLVLVSRCVKAWMRIQSGASANVLEDGVV